MNTRLLARSRSDCPLLFFLPWLVCGQVAGYYYRALAWSTLSIIIVLMLVPVVAVVCWDWQRRQSLGFLAGIVSMLVALPMPLKTAPGPGDRVTALVIQEPKYPQAGAVELVLQILAAEAGQRNRDLAPVVGRRFLCHAVDLPWKNTSGLRRGAVLALQGSFQPLAPSLNPAGFDGRLWRQGYSGRCRIRYAARLSAAQPALWQRVHERLVSGVRRALGENQATELFLSMSIGVRGRLNDRSARDFSRTGLAHLLVVSGYQVTLVYYLTYWMLRWLGSRSRRLIECLPLYWLAPVGGILAATGFVWLIGVDAPSLRAGIAAVLVVLTLITERGGNLFNSILAALLMVTLIWPAAFLEPGVQLTFAALFGIALGSSYRFDGAVKSFLRIYFYTSLFTSVVVAVWFPNLSLIGFLLNPLLAPAASVVSCKLGLISMLAYAAHLDPGAWGLKACWWLVARFGDFVSFCAALPWAAVELTPGLRAAVLAVLLLVIGLILNERRWEYAAGNNLHGPVTDSRLTAGSLCRARQTPSHHRRKGLHGGGSETEL